MARFIHSRLIRIISITAIVILCVVSICYRSLHVSTQWTKFNSYLHRREDVCRCHTCWKENMNHDNANAFAETNGRIVVGDNYDKDGHFTNDISEGVQLVVMEAPQRPFHSHHWYRKLCISVICVPVCACVL